MTDNNVVHVEFPDHHREPAPIPIRVRAVLTRMNALCGASASRPGVPHVRFREGACLRFRDGEDLLHGVVNGDTTRSPEGTFVSMFVEDDLGGQTLYVNVKNVLWPPPLPKLVAD